MRTIAVFDRPETIDCLTNSLEEMEMDPAALSLIMQKPEEEGEIRPEAEVRTQTASRTAKGSLVGGLAGLLVGAATVMIPGVGPLIAAGPLATGLSALVAVASGAAAGASVGALVGLMADLGVPEVEAREYASALERAEGVVMLEHDETQKIADAFRRCGCRNVRTYA